MLTGFVFSNPVNEFLPQGRNTNTYSLSDNAAYQRGRHYIQFGFHGQQVRVRSFDAAGSRADLHAGAWAPASRRSAARELPGISDTDLADANALLASLGGYVDSYSQTLNVTSRTSGFVPGAPFVRHFRLDDYDLYVQDKWRVLPRLTLTLGLRYELPGVLDERDSLELLPVLQRLGGADAALRMRPWISPAAPSGGPDYHRPKKISRPTSASPGTSSATARRRCAAATPSAT